MNWAYEHLGTPALLACWLVALVWLLSWANGNSLLTGIKKTPGAVRLVVGGLFLVGVGNLVMWTPGVVTMIAARHWLGEWGTIFVWPGLAAGFYLLVRIQKPMLAVYRFIAGPED